MGSGTQEQYEEHRNRIRDTNTGSGTQNGIGDPKRDQEPRNRSGDIGNGIRDTNTGSGTLQTASGTQNGIRDMKRDWGPQNRIGALERGGRTPEEGIENPRNGIGNPKMVSGPPEILEESKFPREQKNSQIWGHKMQVEHPKSPEEPQTSPGIPKPLRAPQTHLEALGLRLCLQQHLRPVGDAKSGGGAVLKGAMVKNDWAHQSRVWLT